MGRVRETGMGRAWSFVLVDVSLLWKLCFVI